MIADSQLSVIIVHVLSKQIKGNLLTPDSVNHYDWSCTKIYHYMILVIFIYKRYIPY